MEEKQDSVAEATKPEETPAIVEQAFGKQEAAPTTGEPPAKAVEGSPDSPKEAEPPPNAAPATPKSESRSNRRIQNVMAEMQQLKEKLAKYESGDQAALKSEDAIDKRFAELRLEQAEQQMQEEAYKRFEEAFPNESEQQQFVELAKHYTPIITNYAPAAAQYIANSDVNYKLEKAIYDICGSTPTALNEFLNLPPQMQRTALQKIEECIKNNINPISISASQTPSAPTPPANLPKSITPSDSEANAGKFDAYEATLKNIEENNRRLRGR